MGSILEVSPGDDRTMHAFLGERVGAYGATHALAFTVALVAARKARWPSAAAGAGAVVVPAMRRPHPGKPQSPSDDDAGR